MCFLSPFAVSLSQTSALCLTRCGSHDNAVRVRVRIFRKFKLIAIYIGDENYENNFLGPTRTVKWSENALNITLFRHSPTRLLRDWYLNQGRGTEQYKKLFSNWLAVVGDKRTLFEVIKRRQIYNSAMRGLRRKYGPLPVRNLHLGNKLNIIGFSGKRR